MDVYRSDDHSVGQLLADMDETLVATVQRNNQNVLRYILPDRRIHSYSLRPRRHELMLTTKRDSIVFFREIVV